MEPVYAADEPDAAPVQPVSADVNQARAPATDAMALLTAASHAAEPVEAELVVEVVRACGLLAAVREAQVRKVCLP